MINDNQTNMVYIARGLSAYEPVCMNLMSALDSNGIECEFLPRTPSPKHIWARDYMPLQLDKGRFLSYRYRPDYLRGYEGYIPQYRRIWTDLGLECIQTDIVLDGGNVVKCGSKVIMTDKIFRENTSWGRNELISELERLLRAEIVLIPWDRYEMFGHADGMVRYIVGDSVLLNNYVDFDPYLRKRLLKALRPHFSIAELHYGTAQNKRFSWAYINFLQTENCIFIPGLGLPEDSLAAEQIQGFFPDSKVIQIRDCQSLVLQGGALNCATWNILSDLNNNHYKEIQLRK